MKSKNHPFLFRTLSSGAALFALTPLHAADVDTTLGVTLNANNPGNKYTGAGTLTVSGGGTVKLDTYGGATATEFAMTGGLIDIVSKTTLRNGGWQKGIWTANKADMQVNGTLDLWDGNTVEVNALTGSGSVTLSNPPWSPSWNTTISVGVADNGGGGTFGGTLSDVDNGRLSVIKKGGGTQILTGTNTYRGTTDVKVGTLQIGDGGSTGTLGSGAVTIESRANLTINRGDTYGTVSNQSFSGAGTLIKEGAGDLVFNGTFDANNSVANLQNLTVNNGLVRTDNFGAWKSDLNLTANGSGNFELWSTSTSLGTLNGNGTVQNTVYYDRATTLTVAAGSFSGTITDSGITSGGWERATLGSTSSNPAPARSLSPVTAATMARPPCRPVAALS